MTSQRAFGERVLIVGALIALLWSMDWMYVHVLVAFYGETGFPGYPFAQRGVEFRALCWSIGLIPMVWMPLGASRPSHVLIWCIFLMTVLPTAMV
ncbi:MAG TPA: hypothetical protein VHV78_05690, partial [Gemmatimonadaceae bacterium]|nr:hypothetical protein [Gemmatimonadaceae bacterium]